MTIRSKSQLVKRASSGVSKRDESRRLNGLGLSRHDTDPDIQEQALAIVERFLRWTANQECIVSGKRSGQYLENGGNGYRVVVHPAHIGKRGSWAVDFGNVLPLVDFWHSVQEHHEDFYSEHNIDPVRAAKRHAIRYLMKHPEDAKWLIEHATDGDVIQLARDAGA